MNIFHSVTLRTLRKNRTRTVVTIIGIMLSAALICAVTTFVSSIYNYILEYSIYTDGNWHGSALDADLDTRNMLAESEEIANTVYGQQLGYAALEDCRNDYKPYLYVLGMSEGFADTMPVHLTVGRYPETAGEILLPEHLSSNGGVTYRIGETITLTLGDRQIDGFSLGQHNPFQMDEEEETVLETLVERETRSYTVVGFYERPSYEDYSAPGYTALTLAVADPGASYQYDVWFTMKNAKDVNIFMTDHEISGETNVSLLTYSGVYIDDGILGMMVNMAVIVIALIMFGAVSLIYNAFSISVSERTKQFGLLSSIGGTKKQLRRSVLYEAWVVSIVGIPLGILVGIGGIAVTLLLIGNRFQSIFTIPLPLHVCVSLPAVGIAAAVALLTVLISAWIPSKRATKISAVSAIRQSEDIKTSRREVKTSRLTYRLFGLPGVLASKFYKRSRKKYRATVVSLFMSIVLFISVFSFSSYMMESVTIEFDTATYDLLMYIEEEDFGSITEDELLVDLSDCTGVTGAAYGRMIMQLAEVDKTALSDAAIDRLDLFAFQTEDEEEDKAYISSALLFVDEGYFHTLLEKYHLNEADYFNPDAPLAIAMDHLTGNDAETDKKVTLDVLRRDETEMSCRFEKSIPGYSYSQLKDGIAYYHSTSNEDILEIPEEEAFSQVTLKTGKKIAEQLSIFGGYTQGVVLVYPYSMLEVILPNDYSMVKYFFTSDDHAQSFQAIRETLQELGMPYQQLIDYAAQEEDQRNIVTIMQVLAYGFIVLISLIAAANVFNTISTNIALRRREFAMLKSVGMTQKGFNRMMHFECLLYSCKALLYGLPVAVGITYLIYRAGGGVYDRSFYMPWQPVMIAVLSVFAVMFATMLYSMSKVKKDNPIDALKNENL